MATSSSNANLNFWYSGFCVAVIIPYLGLSSAMIGALLKYRLSLKYVNSIRSLIVSCTLTLVLKSGKPYK